MKDKQWWIFKVLRLQTTQIGITDENMPQIQIQHYHPLNQWLLEATNGNQVQTMVDFYSSGTINNPKWV